MTAPAPTGLCPVCEQPQELRPAGTIIRHYTPWFDHVGRSAPHCRGSGKRPKAEAPAAAGS